MSLGYPGWVKLNVGGEYFNTTLLTLVSCPDSLLAKMFDPDSGREPAYNEDGVYFLDVDPKYFGVILNWLRHREVMADADTNLNNVAKVADFFGLEKLVEELKMIGSVVVVSDEGGAAEMVGEHMGLYLKGADNTYHQAGGEMYLYQDGHGVWFINDTLDQHAGYLQNTSREESNILPRYGWEYGTDETDSWSEDDNLKVIDATNVKFCNIISVSSTKYTRREYLGEFFRSPREWLNGWPVFINKDGKKLGVPSGESEWCVGDATVLQQSDNADYAVSSGRVTSCPAHPRSGSNEEWGTVHWQFWDEKKAQWIEDETMEINCDVHG